MRHSNLSVLAVLTVVLASAESHAQVFPALPPRTATPAAAPTPSAPQVPPSFPGLMIGAGAGSGGGSGPGGLAITGSEAFEVVPLKYADVSEIVGLLTANQSIKPNDNFTPEELAFGSSGLQGGYYGSGITPSSSTTAFTQTLAQGDPVGRAIDDSIGIDRRLNAIVLKGTPEHITQLKGQIAQLDVPVATSVVLETVFVELTESGARNLGIDFNNANGQFGTASYTLAAGDFPGVSNTAAGGGRAVNLQAAIYGQIAKGQGRIISRPRIAAQNGSTAKIITGDALPILTAIALSGVNAVQQQVQYVNVGVTLQIAPRVSDDGYVSSHIFTVVSSLSGYSQGYPTISQREASTSATVRDGEPFVIGGLTQESELNNHIKVPGLGDIPVLGRAFSAVHDTRAKTELYVVVTPHVSRTADHHEAPKIPGL
ncbi:MAG TPA: secretin N-terminal domain-containing protein [Caulobacteraceae bacterium]|jgi:general secretion pathway protein D